MRRRKKLVRTRQDVGRSLLRAEDVDDGFGYVRDLKKDASRIARKHGHDLGSWHRRPNQRTIFDAFCITCNRLAVVNADPDHGLPPIYGHAVTDSCGRIKES